MAVARPTSLFSPASSSPSPASLLRRLEHLSDALAICFRPSAFHLALAQPRLLMHSPLLGLLGLPSAIVVLCVPPAAPQADMLWPYDLPRDIKYFPGTEGLVKRGLGVQQRLASGDRPVGVQKMSSDEGGMQAAKAEPSERA